MDDLQITISLKELLTLIETSKRVPGMESSLASLSRRLDALYALYIQVLERLRLLRQDIDNL